MTSRFPSKVVTRESFKQHSIMNLDYRKQVMKVTSERTIAGVSSTQKYTASSTFGGHHRTPHVKSEPIPFRRQRSLSEEQLSQNLAVAEYRDYCMYSRIVGGIAAVQQAQGKSPSQSPSLASIIKTRQDESPTKSPRSVVGEHSSSKSHGIPLKGPKPPEAAVCQEPTARHGLALEEDRTSVHHADGDSDSDGIFDLDL
jgi:hypothetical protein